MPRISLRRSASDSSRRLTIVFVAVLAPAAVTLVWLAWRLLEQDRALYAQREVERHEAAADGVVRTLSQILADAERRTGDMDGIALLRRDTVGVTIEPRRMAAWVPVAATLREPPSAPFAAAETLEFQGDPQQALLVYRRLAGSTGQGIRAGALLRSARVLRKLRRVDAAAADYRTLARFESVAVNGVPIDLVARRALCDLLAQEHRGSALQQESEALERDFTNGRWQLERDAWELVAAELGGWRKGTFAPTLDQLAVSAAADWLLRAGPAPEAGARVLASDDARVTIVTRGAGTDVRALVIAPSALERLIAAAVAHDAEHSIEVTLLDERGALVAGAGLPAGLSTVRRAPSETALPWTIAVARGNGWTMPDEFQTRRRLFAAGLAALGLLLAGGSYLLWRLVQRELAVARLQTEFVAAVSHEFRTPLTSLRHVIELLDEDDEATRERRKSFYGVLARSTDRLDRLVESLLDFGRMESGRKPYDLQPLDPAALAVAVAREFERDPAARGYRVAVDVASDTPRTIRGDAIALGHALWNLLDNAVKYSPERSLVRVAVAPHRARAVGIAVSDEGIGVPRAERSDIFLKFVRGEQAGRLGIKGTGVGLAIVSHIAHAHGGSVELDSTEGRGSTFRLVLPAAS